MIMIMTKLEKKDVAIRADELEPLRTNNRTGLTESSDNPGVSEECFGRISNPYDLPKQFPETPQCGNFQKGDRRWACPYF